MERRESPYGEGELWEAFKPIRNRLRKFDPLSVTALSIERLHALRYPSLGEGATSELPWNVFQLIKWAHLLGPEVGGEHARLKDYRRLVDAIDDLRGCGSIRAIGLFMKTIANQQFWLQRGWDVRHLLRSQILFGEADPGGKLNQRFEELRGIPIQHFLEMSLALLVLVQGSDRSLDLSALRPLYARHPPARLDQFLESLSISPQDLRQFFRRHVQSTLDGELYERTPLQSNPLLRLGKGVFLPFSKTLVFRSLEHAPFDVLRQADPEWVGQNFGRPFERHVGVDRVPMIV